MWWNSMAAWQKPGERRDKKNSHQSLYRSGKTQNEKAI
jgi:hypothetical protein